jgi:membrane protease subunit (stomatin/prohibitin family)
VSRRAVIGAVGALLLIAGVAVAGYAIGSSSSPDAFDARASRQHAYRDAYDAGLSEARDRSLVNGQKQGIARGRAQGRSAGLNAGRAEGDQAAQAQLAAAQEQAIAEQQAAAQAEAAQRDANCGAPLFVEGYCPTDAEIAQENQAEANAGVPNP